MTSPFSDPPEGADAPEFLVPALQRMASGCRWPEFAEWFVQREIEGFLLFSEAADPAAERQEARRRLLALARQLWARTPDPADRWRLRTLPPSSRNDPCYCGSGRKYKHCCQALVAALEPFDADPRVLAGGLVAEGPQALREPASLRSMPGAMLAAAVQLWGDKHGPAGVVALLEPLFLQPRGLDASHEEAFDALVDAMLQQRLEERREALVRRVVADASERRLRCTARCRLAAMLCDRGRFEPAWEELRAAQREDADDPQLLHLELTILLAQDRLAEARARTPMLAARARKLGYPELAQVLVQMEAAGPAALRQGLELDAGQEQAWIELLRAPLPHLGAQGFAELHAIAPAPKAAGLRIEPTRQVKRSLAPWTRRFGAVLPVLSARHGAADELLGNPEEARQWLAAHPQLCAAVPVLDDLLIAARAMEEAGAGPAVAQAAAELAFAAADLLLAACEPWPQAPIEWADHKNRPALRLVAQAIDLALDRGDDALAVRWMRWMLARNPHDNHGWREELRVLLLRQDDPAGALAVLDAYPDDAPPAGHDRALALFMLHRQGEAQAVLGAEHASFPAFVQALLPPVLDRPAGAQDGIYQFGGADHAWAWREEVRDLWEASGALAWLRGLKLPQPPAARPAAGRTRAGAAPGAPAATSNGGKDASRAAQDGQIDVLRRHYGERLPWLLGWLAGAAWAPELVMPAAWVSGAMEHAGALDAPPSVDALLEALMNCYNAFTEQRLSAAAGEPVPLPGVLAPDDDAGWAGFAAGFLQFAEQHAAGAWRSAGASLRAGKGLFAPLYQLAARAPIAPEGWRALGDEAQPLLALAGEQPPARELLAAALLPLWRLTLAARP